jgi:hypothetical protein
MATEMFLKAFLALKTGLDSTGARKLGHDLDALTQECVRIDTQFDVGKIADRLAVFPTIQQRYTGEELKPSILWDAYGIAQYVAASTVRAFTDRDTRSQFLAPTHL